MAISQPQLRLLERLRDDLDVLIAMLIADENAIATVSPRSVERLVKLIREPRLLFDVADGWPPIEEVVEALKLAPALVRDLAIGLDRLKDALGSHLEIPNAYTGKSVPISQAFKETVASLRGRYAESPLWLLRKWLDGRIRAAGIVQASDITAVATLSVRRAFKPPPLQPFGKGPSLGLRPVGASRNILIEAALLERANNAHEATLQTVRCCLAGCEVECFQSPLIDLACVLSHGPQIFEVKSISAENEVEQVRAAYAQLSDYRFGTRSRLSGERSDYG